MRVSQQNVGYGGSVESLWVFFSSGMYILVFLPYYLTYHKRSPINQLTTQVTHSVTNPLTR